MPGRRHLPGAHEAIGSGEPTSRPGLLTWWQRRSRRTDLAVLARVRDGLRRLDAEACPPAPPPAARSAPEDSADLLPDSAIVSIRDTFRIVLAAGGEPASYFYGRLFASHPRLRAMFPPAMDEQRDRLLRALARIVDGLSSPEDLVEYLTQLGRDHRKYSVEPAMYDMVGEALPRPGRARGMGQQCPGPLRRARH
jgi:transglutaminase-like putative cysteine protease